MRKKLRKWWDDTTYKLARSSSPLAKCAFFVYVMFASPVLRGLIVLAWIIVLLAILATRASASDDRIDALVTFSATGQKTPVGGVGVYSGEYGRRIGTIETLGDGSTVMRGSYGRVIAKVAPRRNATAPIRVEVRQR